MVAKQVDFLKVSTKDNQCKVQILTPPTEVINMREIKFRAWNKKERRFIEVHTLEGTGNKFLFCSDENEKRYCIGVDVEILEYTGLKDKNGKEIYEGDILKFPEAHKNWYGYISFVEHFRGEFRLFSIKKTLDIEKPYVYALSVTVETKLDNSYKSFLEIIGNIYEHSHLLIK